MSREMRCIELVEVVTEWMEGALDDEDRLLLEAHLVTCSACVAYVAQLRVLPVLLGRQPRDGPPPAARAALLDALRRAR
jgi:anti-sigma factor RsiW